MKRQAGEEAVRAGWQKRLNITVDDCHSVQVDQQSTISLSINLINRTNLIFHNLYFMFILPLFITTGVGARARGGGDLIAEQARRV